MISTGHSLFTRGLRLILAAIWAGLLVLLAAILANASWPSPVAAGTGSVYTVCPTECNYSTLQAAVDAAQPGDEIRVSAHVYSDLHLREGITQVLYLSKTLVLRGGFVPPNWTTSQPSAYTILDPQGGGRAIVIVGQIAPSLTGFQLESGDASGLGGYVPSWGGPSHDVGGALYVVSATATLSDIRLVGNSAQYGGGGFFYGAHVQLLGSRVLTNVAAAGAGLYAVDCPNLYLADNLLSANAATGTGSSEGGGGALFSGCEGLLEFNSVVANHAEVRGGGVQLAGGDLLLRRNTMRANTSGGFGGAVYMAGGTSELEANTIVSNTASQYGGGVCVRWADARIRGNTIGHNTADGSGGVDIVYGDYVQVSGNLFEANRALKECGGGLYFSARGGIIEGNVFQNNRANFKGGGVAACTSTALLVANELIANSAGETGGGAYISNSQATLVANTFLTNTAAEGGAVGIRESSTVTIVNTLAAGNRATLEGGAIYVDSSVLRAEHTTLAANPGPSGVCLTRHAEAGASGTFVNTILVGHTLGITVSHDTSAVLQYTLWGSGDWANVQDWAGDGAVTESYSLWRDPGFIAPGDYRLAPHSDAVDAAKLTSVLDDLEGQARPHYAGPDLGADELWLVEAVQSASPATLHSGERLTYTLVLTAPLVSASVCITDTLHPLTLLAGPLIYDAGAGEATSTKVTWCGHLQLGQRVTLSWPVTIVPGVTEAIWVSNAAQIGDQLGVFSASPAGVWVVPHTYCLPLVLKLEP